MFLKKLTWNQQVKVTKKRLQKNEMLAKKANTESHLIKELPTLTLSFASCQALMERLNKVQVYERDQ